MPTVGVLVRDAPGWEQFWKTFPKALNDLGYVERKLKFARDSALAVANPSNSPSTTSGARESLEITRTVRLLLAIRAGDQSPRESNLHQHGVFVR
jgi:hypothetical protein